MAASSEHPCFLQYQPDSLYHHQNVFLGCHTLTSLSSAANALIPESARAQGLDDAYRQRFDTIHMPLKYELKDIPIEDLLLDKLNPRIPDDKKQLSQPELLTYVADTYNSIAVARSIAKHGYFPSEPLIAIKDNKKYIVVEGNRRLAALKLLTDQAAQQSLADPEEWAKLDSEEKVKTVPVVVVKDRRSVAPIIGYRHIAGIQQWDAYAKARYIASQVDDVGLSFDETAAEVGEKPNDVRSHYRNYRISEQARKKGIDTADLIDNFGVFTRAMQSIELRKFIGAPAGNEVKKGTTPVPKAKLDALGELVTFMFGAEPVIQESRDIGRLGKVVASADGLKVLRKTKDLKAAEIASGGHRDRILSRLNTALNALRDAREDIAEYKTDVDVKEMLAECEKAFKDLHK